MTNLASINDELGVLQDVEQIADKIKQDGEILDSFIDIGADIEVDEEEIKDITQNVQQQLIDSGVMVSERLAKLGSGLLQIIPYAIQIKTDTIGLKCNKHSLRIHHVGDKGKGGPLSWYRSDYEYRNVCYVKINSNGKIKLSYMRQGTGYYCNDQEDLCYSASGFLAPSFSIKRSPETAFKKLTEFYVKNGGPYYIRQFFDEYSKFPDYVLEAVKLALTSKRHNLDKLRSNFKPLEEMLR